MTYNLLLSLAPKNKLWCSALESWNLKISLRVCKEETKWFKIVVVLWSWAQKLGVQGVSLILHLPNKINQLFKHVYTFFPLN